jgi:hypothetical protein
MMARGLNRRQDTRYPDWGFPHYLQGNCVQYIDYAATTFATSFLFHHSSVPSFCKHETKPMAGPENCSSLNLIEKRIFVPWQVNAFFDKPQGPGFDRTWQARATYDQKKPVL